MSKANKELVMAIHHIKENQDNIKNMAEMVKREAIEV